MSESILGSDEHILHRTTNKAPAHAETIERKIRGRMKITPPTSLNAGKGVSRRRWKAKSRDRLSRAE
jgi:hypothetical protein